MKNILFCHIPKCSGTSVNNALKKLPKEKYNYCWYTHRILQYDLDKYTNFYKFAIVRHPIKKLCSLYFYQINTIKNLLEKLILTNYQEQNWFNLYKLYEKYNITNIQSFLDNYKVFYYNEIFPYISKLKEINSTKNMSFFYIVGFLPQYLFICDDNKNLLVDDIVNIKNEKQFLHEIFNVKNLEHTNVHPNSFDNYNQYITEKHIQDIKEIYKDDYDCLNKYLKDKFI